MAGYFLSTSACVHETFNSPLFKLYETRHIEMAMRGTRSLSNMASEYLSADYFYSAIMPYKNTPIMSLFAEAIKILGNFGMATSLLSLNVTEHA